MTKQSEVLACGRTRRTFRYRVWGLIKKAERRGNETEVPVAENLGLAGFFKLTYSEMNEDHVMAFAGNPTYKGLFALFPFFTFLLFASGALQCD